jgi:hypothetical protein
MGGWGMNRYWVLMWSKDGVLLGEYEIEASSRMIAIYKTSFLFVIGSGVVNLLDDVVRIECLDQKEYEEGKDDRE